MLQKQMWYNYTGALQTALFQAKDEGKDILELEKEVEAVNLFSSYTYEEDQMVGCLLDKIDALPVNAGYKYNEPSELSEIHKLQTPEMIIKRSYSKDSLPKKIYGGWIGRICGCVLGKPVENWTQKEIQILAEAGNNYPMKDYIDADVDLKDDTGIRKNFLTQKWFKNELNGFAPKDDDTNYTMLALKIVETYGREFKALDVAEAWFDNLPVMHVCTAEMAGYRNMLNHILPPASASYRNPYKEWIGGQIRTDFYGYINPGNPLAAADMAYQDACITHVKNGIYGGMMIAAMIAQAAVTDDLMEVIRVGLAVIPHSSRLYEEVSNVLAWYENGLGYWDAVDKVLTKYPQKVSHNAVHTIPNAMLVVIALLYGEKDFTNTISNAVMPGFDTDCNGATAGSIIGVLMGADSIDEKWYSPFNDTLQTDISGYAEVKISKIAEQTLSYI